MNRVKNLGRTGCRLILGVTLALQLVGCSHPDNGVTKADYDALAQRKPPAPEVAPEPPIPPLQPIMAPAPLPTLGQKLVSVSVPSASVPLREVLVELVRKVNVDADIDPDIKGGIIIYAKERPFLQVIDRICEMANLRYTFKDNVLKIELDRMHHEAYRLDILNSARIATTAIGTSTDVSSAVAGGGGGGNNSSSSDLKGTSTADPWTEIDANIKQILYNSSPLNQPISTNVNKGAEPTTTPSAVATQAETTATGVEEKAAQIAATINKASTAAATGAPAAAPPPPPVTVSSAPVYSINKQAGIVSVFATSRQHKLVKAYLEKVVAKASAQVLIEAKVVEVSLSDTYQTGIDWNVLQKNFQGTTGGFTQQLGSTLGSSPPLSSTGFLRNPFSTAAGGATDYSTFGISTFGGNLAAMVNLMQTFGSVRTLSSPRMTVMNNQSAVLKVAENQVYFTLQVSQTAATAVGVAPTITYTSTLHTVPLGLVMTVQPSIDTENGQVVLSLRPTVSRQVGQVADPAVTLTSSTATSYVPVVDVREMDSVVTINSGEVVIMGGLMQQAVTKQDSGLPGLQDVSGVGAAFKANSDNGQLVELVVFLRATLVHGRDSISPADKEFYQKYTTDPRPFGM